MHRSTIKNSYPLDKHIAKIYVKEAVNGSNRKVLKRLHVKKQRQWNALQVQNGLDDIYEEQEYWMNQIEEEKYFWAFDDKWYEEMMMMDFEREKSIGMDRIEDLDWYPNSLGDYYFDESDWF